MRLGFRSLVTIVAATLLVLGAAAPVDAQSVLGTFNWQLAPFCDVISLSVLAVGPDFSMTGIGDGRNCPSPFILPSFGAAAFNLDGTISIIFANVFPDGFVIHTIATVNPGNLAGTWVDSTGFSGDFIPR